MKFDAIDNWNKSFEYDGLLYFTQRVKEALFHYSSHIHKVPVLNTQLLANEYVTVSELVGKGVINESHLKHVLNEFIDTFSKDIVVQENIDAERRQDILQKLNSSPQHIQEKTMKYLSRVLGDYTDWCKEYLKKIVPEQKEKKKIDFALKSLLAGLIGQGYSHEFIFYFNKKVFVESPVNDLNSLDNFLDRFDFKPRTYIVYVAIVKEALQFQSILEKRLRVSIKEDDGELGLKYDRNLYVIAQLTIEALDERNAANLAYKKLHLFFRYYNFVIEQNENWFFNKAKVENEAGDTAFVNLTAEFLNYARVKETNFAIQASEMIISALLSGDIESFEPIDKAVVLHNTAISNTNLKNSFLNLWSILEILFVTDKSDSKINEIENKIIPILQKEYILEHITDIGENLKENVSTEKFEEYKKNFPDESNWLAQTILLTQNNELRTKIYSDLSTLPVIRSRISQISNDLSTKRNLLSDLERYTQRISWHLKRLYRTRNSIIHSGETPENLKELGEHLHSYVDSCLSEIIIQLAFYGNLASIDDVVIEAQLRSDAIYKCLRKNGKEKLSKEDLAILID